MSLAWIRERSLESSWGRGRGENDIRCPGRSETVFYMWAPTAKLLRGQGGREPLVDNDGCAQALYGQATRMCQIFTSVFKIRGLVSAFTNIQHGSGTRARRLTARKEYFWLEMENGKAYRGRTLMSRTSEVVERPPNPFQKHHPLQALRLKPLLCGSTPPTLALSPKERSPLSLISHC